ncbi:MAG: hypothetical protein DI629_01330 [Mesorhizobium amorphae]|nr:MAG: hypothetical protein DI629_01330 [Mesorhizobium amorphae]
MNNWKLATALCGALLLAAPALAQEQGEQPRIAVTGEGEATVAPDLAMLTLGVMRQAPTAGEALTANSEAMRAVIEAVKALGIAERDIQTAGLQVNPRYEYVERPDRTQESKLVGYEVINSVTVRVRDIAKTGDLFDKAVAAGVNQGGNLSFSNEDPKATLREARKRAVADAIDKAQTLAEAANVKLGRITEITDTVVGMAPIPMRAKSFDAMQSAPAPIQAGENSYSVQVNITFALE